MAYTFLDKALNTKGVLTNKGGQLNNYWGDQINHSIATSNDILTSVSLSVDKANTDIDTSGNQKEWTHTIQGLSFGINGIGRDVTEMDYVVYKDGEMGRYYLMTITQVDESVTQSGFHQKTIQGLNAAAYDLSRKTLRARDFKMITTTSELKGSVGNILRYIFDEMGWDVRVIGNFKDIDYSIEEGTTAQAALQDIIRLFDGEVDAYVLLNNLTAGANVFTGAGTIKRVFEFSEQIGNDDGDAVRLNRNLVSLTKTGARDSLYTKLFVTGNDITIGPANGGRDYLTDDVANRKYNFIGAGSTPVQYLEGVISNSTISNPQALLEWGRKQLKALNHPRYNYTVGATDGKNVHLGDVVIVQDLKASEPIILQSRIISKTISFADPQTDSFILGEFSPIVMKAKNNNSNEELAAKINSANQVAKEASQKAEKAQRSADKANKDVSTIATDVDNKVADAKKYANELDAKQKIAIDTIQGRNQAALDEAKKEREEIVINTDKMLSDANKNLENAKRDLGDGIKSNKSEITNTKVELGTKVSQADYNKKTGELSSQITNVSQKADGLAVTVAANKKDADGKIASNTSEINATKNSIKLKVDKSEWDTNNKLVSADIAQINVNNNKISQDVVKMDGQVKTNTTNITQTSKQITTEVQDRITGDENVLTQTKGLLSSEITSVTRGYKSAIQQSADALGMTMGALNLVIDSNLIEGRKLWSSYPGWEDKWYVGGSLYKGIRPLTINTSGYTSQYFGIQTAQIPRNGMGNLFIKVDVLFRSSGGAETDQLAVYYDEYNSSGVRIGRNNITGWLGNTSKVGVNSKWTAYAKSIKLSTDTAYGMLLYTARGNVTANISRPYVGTVELTGEQYTPGNTTSENTVLQLFKDNFALGIKDNTGALISGINGDTNGTRIAGKKIVLDGNVIATGDFYAKGGNFKNLNASALTTGIIHGPNLDINLNSGLVTFQKGRLWSTNGAIDMNIDQGYLSVANSENNVLIRNGEIAFTRPNLFSPDKDPYLRITNDVISSSFASATVKAKYGVEFNIKGNEASIADMGVQSLAGIKFGKGNSGKLERTLIGGGDQGVKISGGTITTGMLGASPSIIVGQNKSQNGAGNRVFINAEYLHALAVHNKTTSGSANVIVNSDGALVRATSARKYKTDIKNNVPLTDSEKLLNIPLSTWDDIAELKERGKSRRYFGMIAEEVAEAGLDYLVTRESDGTIEGLEYDRIALLLIPMVKQLNEEIKQLKQERETAE